jgi:dephospho-CoA kinase
LGSPEDLRRLESLIHPLVRKKQEDFIARWQKQRASIVVLDIPLLFETGREKELDYVIVVSADDGVQRKRALARPGMTEEKLASILARQMPDAEKRRRADFVIENSGRLEHLRLQVDALSLKLAEIAGNQKP